jgi:hypothetical protein
MSNSLQKRDVRARSGFPLIAATSRTRRHVVKVPTGDVTSASSPRRYQHSIRPNSRSFHSMMRSARSRSDDGTSTSIALAVLRFTASSNLVGCSTGSSPGSAPRSTFPSKFPNCRKVWIWLGPYARSAPSLAPSGHWKIVGRRRAIAFAKIVWLLRKPFARATPPRRRMSGFRCRCAPTAAPRPSESPRCHRPRSQLSALPYPSPAPYSCPAPGR